MYIKKEDYSYFETLCKSLDEAGRKGFLEILLKTAGKKAGTDISKIQVVGDEIYDVRGIEEGQMLTRTMIKKAYKAAKEK
ncbi:MAG: hypothetical protein C0399_12465 [Syntrophus sp. (in: bacteria)]|nr:hypothetical protein [Syntrophus sp. (in: bacteria)]